MRNPALRINRIDSPPLATPTGPAGGETPLHMFSPWDISVIHLESTDMHRRILGSTVAPFDDESVPLSYGDVVRVKMVCPGLSHNGNTCTSNEVEAKGQTYEDNGTALQPDAPPGDFSIRHQQDFLESLSPFVQ